MDQNLGAFCARVDAIAEDANGYSRDDVLLMLLELVRQTSLGSGRAMSLHVWSTAMVDPAVKASLDKHFEAILHSLTQLARKLRDGHQLGPAIHPARVAHAMFALFIPGYILQLLMFPAMEPRTYLNAHRDLWENKSQKAEKAAEGQRAEQEVSQHARFVQ